MNADMQITLTADPKDPNTVFRLHPIIKEGDEIQFETYARIEHVLSGFWLHALRGSNLVQVCSNHSGFFPPLDSLWAEIKSKSFPGEYLTCFHLQCSVHSGLHYNHR